MKKLIILIISIIFYTCSNSTDPDPEPKIYLSPVGTNIALGGQTDLNIVIADNQKSIFGISLQIVYDNAILGFVDSPGFVTGTMFDQSAVSFVQSNDSTIHLGLSQLNGQTSTIGSGTIGTLTFQANAVGNSIVDILQDELFFYDSKGEEITISDLNIVSASITVQ